MDALGSTMTKYSSTSLFCAITNGGMTLVHNHKICTDTMWISKFGKLLQFPHLSECLCIFDFHRI
ncbi:hypothetical protein A2881_05840 [Candidatus Peribacteria bacterium RIFCSPHIGHO2_01_FULL_55_13]|nr:MAG: hypothetical protein A2881_05840 [Candidatus Peribacteria bacterium RIFCSPHIGHO2_01_FULL_55_13]OGJ64327.1 MAG: hypothetical protein A3F36_03755 [Candidatus Peribacteria bacterium RIFCSPHIGHO2_12_FULL_55_11]